MTEALLIESAAIDKYSAGIRRLLKDMVEEVNSAVTDGVSARLSSLDGNQEELYSFVKDEGYDIMYSDFQGFFSDAMAQADESEKELARVAKESYDMEMCDHDLENVAGGKINWKRVGAVAGTALLIGGLAIATGGVGVLALAGAGVVAASTTGVAVGLGMIMAGGVAAGTGVAMKIIQSE